MGGNSGIPARYPNESVFVADYDPGTLDTPFDVVEPKGVVTASIKTTRYVGPVDGAGFLVYGDGAVRAGRLAGSLLLTIRARITAFDASGVLGQDGVSVQVVLHPGETHQRSLGPLHGDFGIDWQDFELTVRTVDLKFPDDPCPDQSTSTPCGQAPVPRPNWISFVFDTTVSLTFEIDWMTLEPRHLPGLACRPVLLLHGWGQSAADMGPGTAWADALGARHMPSYAVDLTPKGLIQDNGTELVGVVSDLTKRFGVERLNIVGFGKGGIDAREYVRRNRGVETVIMLGSPNGGSFAVDLTLFSAALLITDFQVSTPYMAAYNSLYTRNHHVLYVAVSAYCDSPWAKWCAQWVGLNDEDVSVNSVEALPYASGEPPFKTATSDAASLGVTSHDYLRYNATLVSVELPLFLETPGAPLPQGDPPLPSARPLRQPTRSPTEGGAGAPQCVAAQAATVPGSGVAENHEVYVDEVDTAVFHVFTGGNYLTFELVSPSGIALGPDTPSADPSVVYTPLQNAESCWFTAYQVSAPEVGIWTLEVTGRGGAPADSQYGVAALATLPPGLGVLLTIGLDSERPVVGDELTITAVVTADGTPLTDAIVTAQVVEPGGTLATTIAFAYDPTAGEGEYRGSYGPATLTGLYTVVVSAGGTVPAFTRQRVTQVTVVPCATGFSGTFTDRGVDTDDDGRYDQLVIDVGVEVDVAADYRVLGTLIDSAGTPIEQLQVEQHLDPDAGTVSLSFDGARLFGLRVDGPYILEDLTIEDVATSTGLARGPDYTTAAYSHDAFQRPICLLTGHTSDRGVNADPGDQLPYEELLIQVGVDTLVDADVQAVAQLHAEGGTFVTTGRTFASMTAGLNMLDFYFRAPDIFRAGKPGPYKLRLFSMWEISTDQPAVSLRDPHVVAVTQPYALEDFAESPVYNIGGTVTGLEGEGLEVTDFASLESVEPGDGPFTFAQPRSIGSAYDVRVTAQPTNPMQVCSIVNGSGTVGPAAVTDIAVECVTTMVEAGLDHTFGGGGKVTANQAGATGIVLQRDGMIVLLGDRTLTRYDSGGNLDGTFGIAGVVNDVLGSSYSAVAKSVAIQSDGKIVVAGYATSDSQGMHYDFALARYTIGGTLDTDFAGGNLVTTDFAGDTDYGRCVLIQSDGMIVVAGLAVGDAPTPEPQVGVARYTTDGTLDPTFGSGGKVMTPIPGASGSAVSAALQSDGKIVVLAAVDWGDESLDIGLVRYTVDGLPDPDFGGGGIVRAGFAGPQPTGLALRGDDRIVVVGCEAGPFAVACFDTAGNPDSQFAGGAVVTTPFAGGEATAQTVAIQGDGSIVVGGYTAASSSDDFAGEDFALARYTATGELDDNFGDHGQLTVDFFADSDRAKCMAIQPVDGKIVVAGSASRGTLLGLIRLLP